MKLTERAALKPANPDEPRELGALTARASQFATHDDAEPAPADEQTKNQLLRIEIHRGGTAVQANMFDPDNASDYPTFKLSWDNGVAVFPIAVKWVESSGKKVAKPDWTPAADGTVRVRLTTAGRDERFGLAPGSWVEYVDDATVLSPTFADDTANVQASPFAPTRRLFQVLQPDPARNDVDPRMITLQAKDVADTELPPVRDDFPRHAFLRRWDQHDVAKLPVKLNSNWRPAHPVLADDNALLVVAPNGGDAVEWLSVGGNVQIQFKVGYYRPGDSWMVPTRYATEGVIWPQVGDTKVPAEVPATPVRHAYAPLATFTVVAGDLTLSKDCRRIPKGDLTENPA